MTLRNIITDIPGLRVGHAGDVKLGSGTTVVIFDAAVVASVDVRGGGPGTRETALLDAAPAGAAVPDAPELSGPELSGDAERLHLRAQRFARVQVAEMRLKEAAAVHSGAAQKNLYAALRPRIDAARAA